MTRLNIRKNPCWEIFLFCALAVTTSRAQVFTSLASFDSLNGANPAGSFSESPPMAK
jgi:hypothetical protein